MTENLEEIFEEIKKELEFAISHYPSFNSVHEGYSIIKEELDELWDEIKLKKHMRDKKKLKYEALQVATMAIRFIIDIDGKENEPT